MIYAIFNKVPRLCHIFLLRFLTALVMLIVVSTDHNNEKLVHVSTGSQSVWAVTDAGNIYFRIGVTQPVSSALNPAWVRVTDRKKSGVRFCQVVTSENDLMVITQLRMVESIFFKARNIFAEVVFVFLLVIIMRKLTYMALAL